MADSVLNSTAVLRLNFCAKLNICPSISATSPSCKTLYDTRNEKTTMKVIGFRVSSDKKIYYCIIEKLADDSINYLDYSSIEIPQALNWPEALAYTRNTILDILNLYEIKQAVIRIAELDGASLERCYIEGVLQEAIASSPVEKFQTGQISTIASLLRCLLYTSRCV